MGAQCCLGVCYARGKGVAADVPEAIKWFLRSAQRGCNEAYYNLSLQASSSDDSRYEAAPAKKLKADDHNVDRRHVHKGRMYKSAHLVHHEREGTHDQTAGSGYSVRF